MNNKTFRLLVFNSITLSCQGCILSSYLYTNPINSCKSHEFSKIELNESHDEVRNKLGDPSESHDISTIKNNNLCWYDAYDVFEVRCNGRTAGGDSAALVTVSGVSLGLSELYYVPKLLMESIKKHKIIFYYKDEKYIGKAYNGKQIKSDICN
jgi:hypothetical protein